MSDNRRMGPKDSETRERMFDAVERVLKLEGYDKLTARRIANEAGFNHQTVYYYFKDMGELIVATFRRRVTASLVQQKEAAQSASPLRALLRVFDSVPDAKIAAEFSPLVSRIPGLREEVVAYLNESTKIHQDLITKLFAEREVSKHVALDPAVVALLIRAFSQTIAHESALGFSAGHQEARELIEQCLKFLDPLAE